MGGYFFFFFYKKSKSKKKFFGRGRGWGARVSEFFFTKNQNLKEKRGGWNK